MTTTESQVPVGQLVAERPAAAAVLERAGIDYCCSGKRTLADACRDKGIDAQQLLAEIAAEEEQAKLRDQGQHVNWLDRSLTEMCDHIEQTHHVYLKSELPRLGELIEKVVAAHAERHPELTEVRRTFAALRAELEPHMMKEERVLFPAIRQLEQSRRAMAFPFGSIGNPIRVMMDEHDVAGDALKQLRTLTGDFAAPEDACNSYRAMLDAFKNLESDLHQHIHKENNILFPRALALEA
ncbi:MAG: iron-sulfur cluster repair di-iron protein [Gemmatales bacterium]|nr:MAG: iron-sulfur cluster repair di-iron protein [Gemmatales bacterium]